VECVSGTEHGTDVLPIAQRLAKQRFSNRPSRNKVQKQQTVNSNYYVGTYPMHKSKSKICFAARRYVLIPAVQVKLKRKPAAAIDSVTTFPRLVRILNTTKERQIITPHLLELWIETPRWTTRFILATEVTTSRTTKDTCAGTTSIITIPGR